ncbi:LacI family DNA-binding transcriptional regulator [Halocella sp. SP3-1]|uniref:LacI family DNA-binding transcriptional regulator n=1 Tax=Halocella sp. SP3-1 TaxID=2382161 RepID=UPI000F752745|nr:LacI family DNA-binding transcriptional regulator [Halocella sp. SP3-1]AZO96309.1 LacI family transcriptional regulator [Halocella sp. SP3-1]
MATIADVAKEAKVSVATVSRVLNNQDLVRPETAERVYDAIEKLSYKPNILARNFRKNESRVILILAPNITNPYYSHILTGIGDVANEIEYSALIFNTGDDPKREKKGMEMLKKKRADGAILLASSLGCDWLLEYAQEYPVVQCSEYDDKVDISHVAIDNYKAAQDVMEYLIDLGHKRIATISSQNNYISTSLRLKGYKDTLHKHGIKNPNDYIVFSTGDYSFKSGKRAAAQLLQLKSRPTAIFCISDRVALGAISQAKEMGVRVPEDLTIIGFDDVEDTMMFHPYITTVAQPCYEIGRRAAYMLYGQMTKQKITQKELLLKHELIIRESSAPIGKRD